MTLIANRPFMIPRGTSQLVFTPAYEKPLLQLTYNTNGDRATWVKELEEWPDGCTPASRERERHAAFTLPAADILADAIEDYLNNTRPHDHEARKQRARDALKRYRQARDVDLGRVDL